MAFVLKPNVKRHVRLDVGKMDMVDDVLSVMDKYVARKEPSTYLDRNSLGMIMIQRKIQQFVLFLIISAKS